jgi:O-acetylserine/cysteine efflux transporter
MVSLVVWSSLVPPIPLLGLSMLLDTPRALWGSIIHMNLQSVLSILYLAIFATLFGYGIWSMLLSRYPTGKVAPLSLLVPVTGLIVARIVLDERLSALQWVGGAIIIAGLVIANFGPVMAAWFSRSKPKEMK